MLNFTVRGQSIFCDCGFIVSDSVDYLTAFFNFSPDWTGLTKTAQFKQNETVYNVPLYENRCSIPAEITSGELEISVFAVESGGTKRITTAPCCVTVHPSGFSADGETPIPPTPDLYSVLLANLEEALRKAEEDYPKALSELENDAGFITSESLPTKLSSFENDTGFITAQSVPTKLSELEQDLSEFCVGLLQMKKTSQGAHIGYNGSGILDISGYQVSMCPAYGVDISSGKFGDVKIHNLRNPSNDTDAANKKYVDKVYDYVDGITGDISEALDGILAMQASLIGGEGE